MTFVWACQPVICLPLPTKCRAFLNYFPSSCYEIVGQINPHIMLAATITGHSYFKMWGVDGSSHIKEANTKLTPRTGVWRDYIYFGIWCGSQICCEVDACVCLVHSLQCIPQNLALFAAAEVSLFWTAWINESLAARCLLILLHYIPLSCIVCMPVNTKVWVIVSYFFDRLHILMCNPSVISHSNLSVREPPATGLWWRS